MKKSIGTALVIMALTVVFVADMPDAAAKNLPAGGGVTAA